MFSTVAALEMPATHGVQTIATEKRLLPHRGPTWFRICVCVRIPRPTESGEARLSGYFFPGRRRENVPQPLWRKGAPDFRREAPITGRVFLGNRSTPLDFPENSCFESHANRLRIIFHIFSKRHYLQVLLRHLIRGLKTLSSIERAARSPAPETF